MNEMKIHTSGGHPFLRSPHAAFLKMSLPVLISLIAEPVTGLVDTAFVSRLGVFSLSALGVGTMVLSGFFWIFNFLGIGTQTEVAQALGKQDSGRAGQMAGLALLLAAALGILSILVFRPFVPALSQLMGASGDVHRLAVDYLSIRLFGAPAVLMMVASFGIFRGLLDMKTPLYIAVSINVLNVFMDPVLIFGWGRLPSMGVSGAALASVISQWIGAFWAVAAVYRRLSFAGHFPLRDARKFLVVGRDLFFRTGLIFLFLLLTTRAATRAGADAGAAHQAVRQVWLFTALFLDAFAVTGQSLVGYFIGSGQMDTVRKASTIVCVWSTATGAAVAAAMWFSMDLAMAFLVPARAADVFIPAWKVAILTQPLNALAFATDGIHWGTGDYRYLRNVMALASITGFTALHLLDTSAGNTLTHIWIVIACWLSIRSVFGLLRIWPGIGNSPIKGCI